MAKSCRCQSAVVQRHISVITSTHQSRIPGHRNVVFCSAVMRMMARVRGSFWRLRIIRRRIRMRMSGRGFASSRQTNRREAENRKSPLPRDGVVKLNEKGGRQQSRPAFQKKYSRVVLCRGVLFSGNANNDANAGFVYANTNNTPTNTNANIGSQRCLEIFTILHQRRPCHKNTGIVPVNDLGNQGQNISSVKRSW
jgi:hypothetical protein